MKIDKFLPLITLESSNGTKELASALVECGYSLAEVTFRTEATLEIISEMSKVNGITIGAGTVVNVNQVKQAIEAGAKFIVCPGINHEVIKYCLDKNIPVFPGVITPSEIESCKLYGLSTLKLFPVGVFGGISLLKALYGPYKSITFIPTGGVDESNYLDYLEQPNVVSIGGSFFIDSKLIEENNFEKIANTLERIRSNYEFVSRENN